MRVVNVNQSLSEALRDQQAGRFESAERLCRAILEVQPQNVDALHLLGIVFFQTKRVRQGAETLRQALRWNDANAEIQHNLGRMLVELEDSDGARAAFRRAIEIKPDYAEARTRLERLSRAAAPPQAALPTSSGDAPNDVTSTHRDGNAPRLATEEAAAVRSLLERSKQLHQAGKLDDALRAAEQAAQQRPTDAEVAYQAAVVLRALGRLEECLAWYRRAAELAPTMAPLQFNLGVVLQEAQRWDEAEKAYRAALAIDPRYVEALNNLGLLLFRKKAFGEAVACYQSALGIRPEMAITTFNLANALRTMGRAENAQPLYDAAERGGVNNVDLFFQRGSNHLTLGNLDQSIADLTRATQLQPNFPAALNNVGLALRAKGRGDDALAAYDRAIELSPRFAAAHYNRAVLLRDDGKLDEAIVAFSKTIECDPSHLDGYLDLGNALNARGRTYDALTCLRSALDRHLSSASLYNNLGSIYLEAGMVDEALASFRSSLEIEPNPRIYGNVLLAMQYRHGVTLQDLYEPHRDFERLYASRVTRLSSLEPSVSSGERLRIGFISPDLAKHPVGFFLIGVLENLSEHPVDAICYSDRFVKDDMTVRLEAAATVWRDVHGFSDDRLAEQVRHDRIDVLFDLAGHTGRSRLMTFARKPAPVQITWLGYMATTGLAAMDFLLADPHEIPESHEQWFTEKILRMPHAHLCYKPPDYAPAVAPAPAETNGFVTFGCFNNLAKITPELVAAWSEALRRMPTARLFLKSKGLDDPMVAKRYRDMFRASGIDNSRIDMEGRSPHPDLLASYARVDVALDTFPYTGCLTTCEALDMGVPVVSCAGDTLTSRQSSSCVINGDPTQGVASDLRCYVELALTGGDRALASGASQRRIDRRARFRQSPVCDCRAFTRDILSVIRAMRKSL